MRKKLPKSPPWRARLVLSNRHRRILVTLALLILALMILFQQNRPRQFHPSRDEVPSIPQDHRRYDGQWATVVKVVDGDTLDIDIPDTQHATTRIRLWGVDTPETKHSRYGQMYYGPEASAFTEKLVLNRRVRILLEPDQKPRDKYGRLLAYIFLEDRTMLNEQLLIHGFAYADERFEHLYRRRFLQHQKQAQKNQRGLWQNARPDQWPQWYRQRHDPTYQKK